jgi:hypothetical protein
VKRAKFVMDGGGARHVAGVRGISHGGHLFWRHVGSGGDEPLAADGIRGMGLMAPQRSLGRGAGWSRP